MFEIWLIGVILITPNFLLMDVQDHKTKGTGNIVAATMASAVNGLVWPWWVCNRLMNLLHGQA